MERETQVTNMQVRSRTRLTEAATEVSRAEEWTNKHPGFGKRFLQLDRLVRDLAVVSCLFLLVVAVKNTTTPEAQSVFGALQESAGMQWDESVGKLSFVNGWLPQGVQAVWNEGVESVTVLAPVHGDVVHAWSQAEPYLLLDTQVRDVRASADGEVMSVAHGLEEERILRVRHDDGSEALYGNLESCYVSEGDRVIGGEIIATLIEEKPLAFEWRVEGRSVDPSARMTAVEP